MQGICRRVKLHGVEAPKVVYRDRCACLDAPGMRALAANLELPNLRARACPYLLSALRARVSAPHAFGRRSVPAALCTTPLSVKEASFKVIFPAV